MIKFYDTILFCFLFVLQVYSDEAIQPKLTCASMCAKVDYGNAGICCSKNISKY